MRIVWPSSRNPERISKDLFLGNPPLPSPILSGLSVSVFLCLFIHFLSFLLAVFLFFSSPSFIFLSFLSPFPLPLPSRCLEFVARIIRDVSNSSYPEQIGQKQRAGAHKEREWSGRRRRGRRKRRRRRDRFNRDNSINQIPIGADSLHQDLITGSRCASFLVFAPQSNLLSFKRALFAILRPSSAITSLLPSPEDFSLPFSLSLPLPPLFIYSLLFLFAAVEVDDEGRGRRRRRRERLRKDFNGLFDDSSRLSMMDLLT